MSLGSKGEMQLRATSVSMEMTRGISTAATSANPANVRSTGLDGRDVTKFVFAFDNMQMLTTFQLLGTRRISGSISGESE